MRPLWLLLLLLGGCASAKGVQGPQGRATYIIECPGMAAFMNACFRSANRLCPSGYAVLDAQPTVDSGTAELGIGERTPQRRLVVQCFWSEPAAASDRGTLAALLVADPRWPGGKGVRQQREPSRPVTAAV